MCDNGISNNLQHSCGDSPSGTRDELDPRLLLRAFGWFDTHMTPTRGRYDSACQDGEVAAAPDPFGAQSAAISALAGYPVTAPALPRPVVFDQHWRDVTFVHWPVPPESVAHMYPPGTCRTSLRAG